MALSKKQIKEFEKLEKEAFYTYDIGALADAIAKAGDEDWARKLYEKAEEKTNNAYELQILASSIFNKISDKEWAKKVYKKAENKAETCNDFRDLAGSILEKLNDKKWV